MNNILISNFVILDKRNFSGSKTTYVGKTQVFVLLSDISYVMHPVGRRNAAKTSQYHSDKSFALIGPKTGSLKRIRKSEIAF